MLTSRLLEMLKCSLLRLGMKELAVLDACIFRFTGFGLGALVLLELYFLNAYVLELGGGCLVALIGLSLDLLICLTL